MPDTFAYTDTATPPVTTTVSFHIGGLPDDQRGEAGSLDTIRKTRDGTVFIDVLGQDDPVHTLNCHWDVYGPASNLNSYLAMRALRSKVGTLTRLYANGDSPVTVYLRSVNYTRRDWDGYTEGTITYVEVG